MSLNDFHDIRNFQEIVRLAQFARLQWSSGESDLLGKFWRNSW